MTSLLGFVVLARRPNMPHGYSYEPVSAVFPEYPNGLEQAQNACESQNSKRDSFDRDPDLGVVYVVGAITEGTP
ncbi:hypothetical protein [Mycobacterium intracellulare]|uniref:hypothetical protein n=1 Tax=Mycobacterium intracellulare TaxID=1767 RepID=UPI00080BF2AA|nr:hypothetical protein [Mycobacterium intracellulare]OCB15094.1 hypothetical protein A5689_26940 [Mycobacterium intracellulare subsp. yongonense]